MTASRKAEEGSSGGSSSSLISLQCAIDHPSPANKEGATTQREGGTDADGEDGEGRKEQSAATTKAVDGRPAEGGFTLVGLRDSIRAQSTIPQPQLLL